MEAIPIGVFWCIAAWAVFKKPSAIIYLFFASMPFGSFAVVPTEFTGGLTLTPGPVIALLLIGRELSAPKRIRDAVSSLLDPFRLLPLLLFWIIAAVATAFMPRFFAGQIEVIPVRSDSFVTPALLFPTAQNVSQFVYITISTLTVVVFSQLLLRDGMRRHALNALTLGALVYVCTGLIDFASQYVALQPVLEVFRTASYALLTDNEVLDSRRIVGLMPEASAFGAVGISFLTALYFFRRAMPFGELRNKVAPILICMLGLSVWVSTSSAAYLGLALFIIAIVAEWIWRFIAVKRNPYLRIGLPFEFMLGATGAGLILLILIAMPAIFTPILNMIDVMVFQKSTSSSFEERGMWTQVSWEALVASNWLGVGIGSTRASNFVVAMLSNAGLLGGIIYFMFVVRCLLFKPAQSGDLQGQAISSACRWAFLPAFCAMLTVGTTPDFGLFNAFLFGFATAVGKSRIKIRVDDFNCMRQLEKAATP